MALASYHQSVTKCVLIRSHNGGHIPVHLPYRVSRKILTYKDVVEHPSSKVFKM